MSITEHRRRLDEIERRAMRKMRDPRHQGWTTLMADLRDGEAPSVEQLQHEDKGIGAGLDDEGDAYEARERVARFDQF